MKKLLWATASLIFITTITLQNASARSWPSVSNTSPTATTNTDSTNIDPTSAAPAAGTLQDRLQERKLQTDTAKEEIQTTRLEQIKTRFKNAIDRMIRHLETLKNRVQNHPNIDDDAENQILARLDRDINWLNERLAELETISSLEDLRAHKNQIKDYWSKIGVERKYIVVNILVARAKHFAQRLEEAIAVIEEKITELQTEGVNTSTSEDMIAQAKKHLVEAKDKFNMALDIYTLVEIQDPSELFQDSIDYLREARQEALEALRLVKQAVVEVKKLSRSESVD